MPFDTPPSEANSASQQTGTPVPGSTKPLDERLREAGETIEVEARRVIRYINDEIVPDVRRNGSQALRFAATELQKLAQRMEDARHPSTPPPPPPGAPSSTSTPNGSGPGSSTV